MQLVDGQLVLSPTDLTKHLACGHLTVLDLGAARDDNGHRVTPPDEALALVFRKGLEHESSFLGRLRDEGRSVVEIPVEFTAAGRRRGEALTVAAMRAGAEVIYQAVFFDGAWGGQADFLLRQERPSALGGWSCDIADTKLARRLKVAALLQMATYAERLTALQGAPPEQLIVVTGDGQQRGWRLADVAAFVDAPAVTEAVPVGHCAQCRWAAGCEQEWAQADDLSLVAFMRADHRLALRAAGISTVGLLAGADPDLLPRMIGGPSRQRLVAQARLQVAERVSGEPGYELLSPAAGRGCCGSQPPAGGMCIWTSKVTRTPRVAPAGSTWPGCGTGTGCSPRSGPMTVRQSGG